jgi:hypothetical protein
MRVKGSYFLYIFETVMNAFTLTYQSMEPVKFGAFYLQFQSWFAVQLEVDWPAGIFSNMAFASCNNQLRQYFVLGEIIFMSFKSLNRLPFRFFLIQLFGWLQSDKFSLSTLTLIKESAFGTKKNCCNYLEL